MKKLESILQNPNPKDISRRDLLRRLTYFGSTGAIGLWGLQSEGSALSPRRILDQLVSPNVALSRIDRDDHWELHTNALPNHPVGVFPNPNCPFPVQAVMRTFKIPKSPALAAAPTPLSYKLFGLAVNGVAFDPCGPYYHQDISIGWQFEVASPVVAPQMGLDSNNAHSQGSGEYHYHGFPDVLFRLLEAERVRRNEAEHMTLLGWAADGFPIYAPRAHQDPMDPQSPLVDISSRYGCITQGHYGRPTGKYLNFDLGTFVLDYFYLGQQDPKRDLDECNGRFGVTPEFPQGIYHYFLTRQWPYIPRSHMGTPDNSFLHGPPAGISPPANFKLG